MSSPDELDSSLDLGQTVRGLVAGQKLFGRYVLVRILGRGGMGVVWLAQDQELEIPIALKFLPEEINRDAEAVANLKRETRRGLELGHPQIVKTYGFLRDDRAAAIAMEFVDGQTLSALKAERDERPWFEVEEIKPWVRQMCEALDYAHNRARVLHRDLKPINVMLSKRGEIKITDFGVAHVLQDSASRVSARVGSSGGTLMFMSPQQAVGESPTVADDVYSLGATLYDLLSGKPPFGGNASTIYIQVRDKVPAPIVNRRAELGIPGGAQVPREWQETIAACLAKDPAKRPQSVGEVAKRLGLAGPWSQTSGLVDDAQREMTISEAAEGRPHHARLRRKLFVSGAIAALIITVGGFAWHYARKAEETGLALQRSEERAKVQGDQREREQKEKEEARVLAQEERERRDKEEVNRRAKIAEQEQTERARKAAAEAEVERHKQEEAKQKAEPVIFSAVTKDKPYENGLGMKFVQVSGTKALFSIWETRVKDFAAFVEAAKPDMTEGMRSLEAGNNWARAGRTWRDPGFSQTGEHAVCGVSWQDATAFCEWLTQQERKAGRIGPNQSYRLPSDEEWSAAVGLSGERGTTPHAKSGKVTGEYPWGTTFPPSNGAGNYGGSEARTGGWPSDFKTMPGYRDEYSRTSPVGSFAPNRHGIYDLGGNLFEWCDDWYDDKQQSRVVRGASWFSRDRDTLLSSFRRGDPPTYRFDDRGFRCVLADSSVR